MNTYISREQDYALRITALLASLEKEKFISIQNLANTLFLSKNFAARIVHKLKNAGILTTIQGQKGGVFLERDSDSLSIFEIMEVIGFKSKLNKCLCEGYVCGLSYKCKLHNFFEKEEQRLLDVFKNITISQFKL